MPKTILYLFIIILGIEECSNQSSFNYEEQGIASYYHDALEGNMTANGEIFSQDSLTAAHRTLPFGTRVLVVRPENGKKILVTINDRGPFNYNRIIDLSKRAADSLDIKEVGIAEVIIMASVAEDYLLKIGYKK